MGRGIAYVGAIGGYTVTIIDINESALENTIIDSIFEKGLARGKIFWQIGLNSTSKFKL